MARDRYIDRRGERKRDNVLNDYLDEDPSSRAKSPRRTKSPPAVMQVDNLEGAAAGGYGAPAEDEGGRCNC